MSARDVEPVPRRYNVGTLLDAQLEAGRDGAEALRTGSTAVTYGELLTLACRFGSGLRRLGAGVGERVLFSLDDSPELVAGLLGAVRAGLLPVLLNPAATPDEVAQAVDDTDAVVHIGRGGEAGGGDAVSVTRTGGTDITVADLLAGGDDWLSPARTHRDDPAFILFSSGSTGRPKGVVHAHRDLPYVAAAYGRSVLGTSPGDRALSTSRIHHAYGLCNSVGMPLWAGATSVLLPGNRHLPAILDAVRAHTATLFFSVPALYRALAELPGHGPADWSSVRMCLSAGEALRSAVWHRFRVVTGQEIVDGIGSTEMLGVFCSNRVGAAVPGTTGEPVPGYRLRLLDEAGDVVSGAGEGLLQVDGGSAFTGYWRDRDLTRDTLHGRWVSTNDLFRRDAAGRYTQLGRADDMVKVNGQWVAPDAVEDVLVAHPGVAEAAAVGYTDGELTRIEAYVVPAQLGAEPAGLTRELYGWCAGRLRGHEYPRRLHIVTGLPRTSTGKLQRSRLRTGEPS